MTGLPIGVRLPVTGPIAGREAIQAIATRAEQLGFDSAWASEHVLIPRHVSSRYPGTADGAFPFPPEHAWLEPLTTLTWVAAVAPRLRIGTSILILPMHNPILVAKQASTLDFLSGGRLLLGVGVGWMEEEFRMLGSPFEERIERTEEGVALMRALWSGEPVRFAGRFWSVADAGMRPLPVRRTVPVLWGGYSRAALRRIARIGDGWIAADRTTVQLETEVGDLRRFCEEFGRDPATLQIWAKPGSSFEASVETIEELAAAGATAVLIDSPPSLDIEAQLERLELLARACALGRRSYDAGSLGRPT